MSNGRELPMGKPDNAHLIEKLNEDLASEFRSIVQYDLHINSIKGAEYRQIREAAAASWCGRFTVAV